MRYGWMSIFPVLAMSAGMAPAAPASPAAQPGFDSGLPEPEAGKALVAVACRFPPSGVLTDCRAYDSKPKWVGDSKAAVEKVEGQTRAGAGRSETTVRLQVKVDLTPPAEPAAATVLVRTDWAREPTRAQLASVYPAVAMEAGIAGQAVMSCRVRTSGEVYSCLVVSERPTGAGFGAAVLRLAPYFQMQPRIQGDEPIGGTVVIPLIFSPPR